MIIFFWLLKLHGCKMSVFSDANKIHQKGSAWTSASNNWRAVITFQNNRCFSLRNFVTTKKSSLKFIEGTINLLTASHSLNSCPLIKIEYFAWRFEFSAPISNTLSVHCYFVIKNNYYLFRSCMPCRHCDL